MAGVVANPRSVLVLVSRRGKENQPLPSRSETYPHGRGLLALAPIFLRSCVASCNVTVNSTEMLLMLNGKSGITGWH